MQQLDHAHLERGWVHALQAVVDVLQQLPPRLFLLQYLLALRLQPLHLCVLFGGRLVDELLAVRGEREFNLHDERARLRSEHARAVAVRFPHLRLRGEGRRRGGGRRNEVGGGAGGEGQRTRKEDDEDEDEEREGSQGNEGGRASDRQRGEPVTPVRSVAPLRSVCRRLCSPYRPST